MEFLQELGRRLAAISDDNRQTSFLFQRICNTLQRFNAYGSCIRTATTEINVGISELVQKWISFSIQTNNYDEKGSYKSRTKGVGRSYIGW